MQSHITYCPKTGYPVIQNFTILWEWRRNILFQFAKKQWAVDTQKYFPLCSHNAISSGQPNALMEYQNYLKT